MLSSLSNYLFNTALPLDDVTNITNNSRTNPEYLTQELDDDWLLVNRLGDSEESNPSEISDSDSADLSLSPPAAQLVFKDCKKRTKAKQSRSRKNQALKLRVPTSSSPDNRSSPPSSPNQQMDGSWFVTPPPCFTASTGPVATSPMENLLIEHPSMSVYGPIQGYSLLQGSRSSDTSDDGENICADWLTQLPVTNSTVRRQLQTLDERDTQCYQALTESLATLPDHQNQLEINIEEGRAARLAQRVRHRRLSCVNVDCALMEKRSATSSRNYQQQLEQRKMKPSYMERQNLARQYQSNNKRQRNRSHLKQPAKYCGNHC